MKNHTEIMTERERCFRIAHDMAFTARELRLASPETASEYILTSLYHEEMTAVRIANAILSPETAL
jgi:hypothetical protein